MEQYVIGIDSELVKGYESDRQLPNVNSTAAFTSTGWKQNICILLDSKAGGK
jgi:hypothetical protein